MTSGEGRAWSSLEVLLARGVPGEGEEDVVEVGRVHGEVLDLDRGVVEAVEDRPQRAQAAVARHLQGERVVVAPPSAGRAAQGVRGRLEPAGVGEPQPDMAARDAPLELLRGALRDEL